MKITITTTAKQRVSLIQDLSFTVRMQLKCEFVCFYWHSELKVVQSSRIYNLNIFKVCLIQAVSVPDASCDIFLYCCLLQAVPDPRGPNREFVCFYCCLIQAVPLPVELVRHSVCLHKGACVYSQLLCERYVWVVGVRLRPTPVASRSHSHTLPIHARFASTHTHTRQPFRIVPHVVLVCLAKGSLFDSCRILCLSVSVLGNTGSVKFTFTHASHSRIENTHALVKGLRRCTSHLL